MLTGSIREMATYRELKERAAALNLLIQEARDVEFEAVLEDVRMRVKEFGSRPLTFSIFRKTAVEGSPASDRAIGIPRLVPNGAASDVSLFGSKEKTGARSKSRRISGLVMAQQTDTQRRTRRSA
jgi:hypothetical protein